MSALHAWHLETAKQRTVLLLRDRRRWGPVPARDDVEMQHLVDFDPTTALKVARSLTEERRDQLSSFAFVSWGFVEARGR